MFRELISLFLFSIAVGCSGQGKSEKPATQLTSHEDTTFCSVPKASDFDSHLSDVEQTNTLRAALEKSKLKSDSNLVVGTSSEESLMRWILFALTPLSMGCKNYEKGGVQKYGEKAFVNFVSVAADALRKNALGGLAPVEAKQTAHRNLTQNQKKFIGILLAINRRVREDQKADFRSPGQDVIHGVPLSAQEELVMKDISKEGLLKVVTYDRPFKNATGDMVSGRFLHYPTGSEVIKHIVGLSEFFEKSQSKNNQDYQDDTARIMRRCITIHPFPDANGRTCTLTALWMQAQRKLPHSVLWSGEDVLLQESEFVLRYQKGVNFHEEIKRSFH
ncbi:MAG: Fic/DOC family [Pseudomonadota bacterium]|jgi:hypothetical protein